MIDLTEFKNRKPYYQSCEGVITLMWIPGIATGQRLKEALGIGYESIIGVYRNDYCEWIYDKADLKKLTDYLLINAEKNDKFIDGLILKWKTDLSKFDSICKKLDGIELKKCTDKELAAEFEEFTQNHYNVWRMPIIADAISLHSESLARHGVLELLQSRGEEAQFSSYFPILTAPIGHSFANNEKRDLLEILAKLQKISISGKIKLANAKSAIKIILENKAISKMLSNHCKKYHWIRNNYLRASYLEEKDFAAEIVEMQKDGKDAVYEIEKLEKKYVETRKQKEELIRKLKISGKLGLILGLIERFGGWMDERKKINLIGDHYTSQFMHEFASRMGLTYFEIAYMTPEEMVIGLRTAKVDRNLLHERRKYSVILITEKIAKILVGKEAEKLESLVSTKDIGDLSDLRGQCASIGRVEGHVKIIRGISDVHKMQKGDILVSSMTRPELVPAMRKALAIVTDEGGITSHAAIVSRELGIPCVIGTKYATKVLKDGDFVEVNANHGLVRKIS